MNLTESDRAVVFHAGALGDSVMIWPLCRALRAGGWAVTLVSAFEKAQLAASELGIHAFDSEQPECAGLWAGRVAREFLSGARLVISMVADGSSDAGRLWMETVRASAPGAELLEVGPPGSQTRAALWSRLKVLTAGAVGARQGSGGSVILHVGAGSQQKRWPLVNFFIVEETLRARGFDVRLVGGEVEAEKFTATDLRLFRGRNGELLSTLGQLVEVIRPARLVVCCDSGPGHLAAQLGTPTLSLFGPTDPAIWAPTGPRVVVLAPVRISAMTWLSSSVVIRKAESMLGTDPALR